MIVHCWAFTELRMDFNLILLTLNVVIHSFTKPYLHHFTDTCGCDGDDSYVKTIFNTQGNRQRTEIVHKAATEMVKKCVMLRGKWQVAG